MARLIVLLVMVYTSAFLNAQVNEIPKYKPVDKELHEEITKMDSLFFDAYNNCNMKVQAEILSEDLEFFHDRGGLSTSKTAILKALKNNICNKVTRTLIKGSIEVYPIPNYGAVQMGYHKFFNKQEPNEKQVASKFVTIWKKENNKWQITRVISLH
ncbi:MULTISPECIES: nuclear transport factor 2 family protein [Tenacibaculum]|uniref:nuclear transport factor 2 family protein n=1 Tax=Tenacibaculum TaxID=104267 RepID=UPI001F0B1229|nr:MULTISPECIES: nuclear transport factor 2 family protein [Tenacibaculum]MCH3883042.1 nuclear transport factor 2 family protein [Tenacibaculum aquimarinum]MDO6600537.1 nuclear transport factor 2 family protein [Tenacibaculum sp. 1_MG-2023]